MILREYVTFYKSLKNIKYMLIHGKIIQSISQMNSLYDFVIEIQNERNEDNGTKKKNFWSIR